MIEKDKAALNELLIKLKESNYSVCPRCEPALEVFYISRAGTTVYTCPNDHKWAKPSTRYTAGYIG